MQPRVEAADRQTHQAAADKDNPQRPFAISQANPGARHAHQHQRKRQLPVVRENSWRNRRHQQAANSAAQCNHEIETGQIAGRGLGMCKLAMAKQAD